MGCGPVRVPTLATRRPIPPPLPAGARATCTDRTFSVNLTALCQLRCGASSPTIRMCPYGPAWSHETERGRRGRRRLNVTGGQGPQNDEHEGDAFGCSGIYTYAK
jgi:hypothetical protein